MIAARLGAAIAPYAIGYEPQDATALG